MATLNKYAALAPLLLSTTVLADVLRCESWRSLAGYSVEAGSVVYFDSNVRVVSRVVAGGDPRSFETFRRPGRCFSAYGRDRDAVYFEGVKIPLADRQSFVPVAEIYARDDKWWYGEGRRIASRQRGELRLLSPDYAAHPEGAFYGARRLEAQGFEVLGSQGYARSANRAYFRGEELAGIDAASFGVSPRDDSVAKDKRKVVIRGRVQERFDGATFEVLPGAGGLARDRNHVYYMSRPVDGADPASFAPIGSGYWRDLASVYVFGTRIEGADPQSFRVMRPRYAMDKYRVYYDGAPLEDADPASFQLLRSDYAKDKASVYFRARRLSGADAASFSTKGPRGRDKSFGYEQDRRVCAWTKETDPALPLCDRTRYQP